MSRLYINPTVQRMIESYCADNGISDLNAFANRCALNGLNILKYGTSPSDNLDRERKGVSDYEKKKMVKNVKEAEAGSKGYHAEGCDGVEGVEQVKVNVGKADEEGGKQEKGSDEEKHVVKRTIKLIRKS